MPTKPPPITIGQNIRIAREAASLTQLQLAQRLGHTSEDAGAYISRVEADKIQPTLITLQRIARSLGTTLDALLPETGIK